MGLKVRFIIIAILLGLRLWGANSELVKSATVIGMTFTAFTIIFSLVKGRNKRPMGGNYAFAGIFTAVLGVAVISYMLLKNGMNIFLFPVIFISLAVFAVSLIFMKKRNKLIIFIGGLLGGAAIAVVVIGFTTYFLTGVQNGFTPINETYNVALSNFVWAR